jgi:ribosome-associated heat shock protein Hsp15
VKALPDKAGKVRLDKWLWAARFFKTRALASEAVSGGKVHVGDQRVKPARAVNVGDQLSIRKGPYRFQIVVLGLSGRRGPAMDAAKLYQETEDSARARESLAADLRAQRASVPDDGGRPSKRDRRQIHRFTGRGRA